MCEHASPPRSSWLQPPQRVTLDAFLHGAACNILLVVASGILASFMFPPREVWWFAWLYLVPLLVALRRTAAVRASGWLALLFGIVFFTCTLSWLRTIFGFSVIGIFTLAALPFVLFGLAYRGMVGLTAAWPSRLHAGLAVAALAPVFWLAAEWIRCEGWYFQFSWAQFGFTLASCRRGGVLYPYLGVYGTTFLIMLVNALLAEVVVAKARWTKRLAALAAITLPITALSLYLNVPVGIPNMPGERTAPVRVQVVQVESSGLDAIKTEVQRRASYRPDLIVCPEYAILDHPLEDAKVLMELQQIARTSHSTLVIGCKDRPQPGSRVDFLRKRAMLMMEGALFGNVALVIGPDGKVLGMYHKTHPIQFFSDGVPGRTYPTFATPVGRLGIAICYDFDFAASPRRLVRNGAELLVVPTFDAGEWSDLQHTQHARMAQARAAETGRWTVRATSSGVSQVINPAGFITAVIWEGQDSTIGHAVPQRDKTLYVRALYLLPYLCLGLSLAWALWAALDWLRQRRRRMNGDTCAVSDEARGHLKGV